MLWIEVLFLLAPLLLVPLALRAIGPEEWPPGLRLALPCAALAAVVSFLFPAGDDAAVLVYPWLMVTLFLATRGVRRLRSEPAIGAALSFLPIGGGWLVLSRSGASPMGFREPIVLLTAVHFHYAAFVTLVLVGLAGRALGPSRVHRAVVAGTIVGTPLLALGITVSRGIEMVGAVVLALSLWVFAAVSLVRVAPRVAGAARVLLSISALSLFPSMALAVVYAWGRLTGSSPVDLATVAHVHGPLNALGFGLCGLLGWSLASPAPPASVQEGRRQR